MKRGALLVLEGCDRAGKTTQAKLLQRSLKELSIPAEIRHFPDRSTEIGKLIDSYLTGQKNLAPETIYLLFAANRWESRNDIIEILESGTTLILDRYVASGAAFAQANMGKSIAWCKSADIGLPCPDKTFLIEVNQEDQRLRLNFGQEKFEKREIQLKVAENFRKLMDSETWQIVNGSRNVEEIHGDILAESLTIIKKLKEESIKEIT